MTSLRKTALVAGVFYLITFISIPSLALYGPVKTHRDYIISSGADTGLLWGGFLEVIVALAGIGTAVTLYPVVKRQNEGIALGFVATRTLEATMIFTGVVSLLSLVTLRQDLGGAAGADAASLVTTGASLVAIHNWTFVLGQSLMPGINALLLGSLMYRSGLVPRVIPLMGLIGAPLLITATFAQLFGILAQDSAPWPRSPRFRWLLGSSRLASIWSSKALNPPPSQLEWSLPAPRPPTATSPSNSRKHGRAHQGPGRCPPPGTRPGPLRTAPCPAHLTPVPGASPAVQGGVSPG